MMLGPFTLNDAYCGDNMYLMSRLPDECIDLTVTSPPYDPLDENLNVMIKKGLRTYNGYTWDFRKVAGQLWRVTKVGGVLVWVVGDSTINGSETGTPERQALYFMSLGFNKETMIYEAAGTGAKGSHDFYWQAFEFMYVFTKGKPKTINLIADRKNIGAGRITRGERLKVNGEQKTVKSRLVAEFSKRTNIWRYRAQNLNNGTGGHPAPFPEKLARDHILSWSNPLDLVFDPFCGSGTTLKMAQETGRNFLGFDISAEYVELSKRRIQGAKIPFPQLTGVL